MQDCVWFFGPRFVGVLLINRKRPMLSYDKFPIHFIRPMYEEYDKLVLQCSQGAVAWSLRSMAGHYQIR